MTPDLILYGGAFDPPHQGHIDCIHSACSRFPTASLAVLVSPSPATIDKDSKNTCSTFEERWDMCQIAFQGLPCANVYLSEIERNLPQPNFTVNTLRAIREQNPNKRLAFLMGEDQFRDFPKWKDPRDILAMASLIVVSRKGTNFISDKTWETISKNLDLEFTIDQDTATTAALSSSITIIRDDVCEATSTELRERYSTTENAPPGWVPAPLHQLIVTKKIYARGCS